MRGRVFSATEVRTIRRIVEATRTLGRTQASIRICEELNWRQPNGWLKDRACRDVLRMLEAEGVLTLPAQKSNPEGNRRRGSVPPESQFPTTPSVDEVPDSALGLRQVKGTKLEPLWNAFVRQYHYLGFRVAVGRSLKYLTYSGDRVIAAIGFSDSAWALRVRDEFLQQLSWPLADARHQILNNSRFVIAPWVRTPNLASRILARAVRRVATDWQGYYQVRPLLVETFVDIQRFTGSSYKAANWHYLGLSKGYLKSGAYHSNGQAPKAVFVYPLHRRIAAALRKHKM